MSSFHRLIGQVRTLDRYIFNASWLIGEKLFRLGIGFLTTAFMARYLGPEKFGILSYALSFVALFSAFGHAGLSGLVVQELVIGKEADEKILGTSAFLKLVGVIVGIASVLGVGFFVRSGSDEFVVLTVVALTMLFTPFEVIGYWFESKVKAKYISLSHAAALLFSSFLRIVLVLAGASLIWFAFAQVAQILLASLLLAAAYKTYSLSTVVRWTVSLEYAKGLLRKGWVVYLGAIFSVIYLKIDQVMLNWLIGPEAVGVYSVASTISEVWYFIPAAIASTVFPKLIKLNESNADVYERRLQQLFDLLFMIALCTAIFVSLCSQFVIDLFFGNQFSAAAGILNIHIWAAIFVFLRAAFSKWMFIEDALMFSLVTQCTGAVINVLLNLILIPRYGGVGAAIATLISYAAASYFSLLCHKRTRKIFRMMTLAGISPLRYSWRYLKLE